MAAPKTKPRSFADKIAQRMGLRCFLCGAKHSSPSTMSVSYIRKDDKTDDTAFLACPHCVKRRDNKPLGAYLRERMQDALAEHNYIRDFLNRDDPEAIARLEALQNLRGLGLPTEDQHVIKPGRHIRDVKKMELSLMQWEELELLDRRDLTDDESSMYAPFLRSAKARSGMKGYTSEDILHADESGWFYRQHEDGTHTLMDDTFATHE